MDNQDVSQDVAEEVVDTEVSEEVEGEELEASGEQQEDSEEGSGEAQIPQSKAAKADLKADLKQMTKTLKLKVDGQEIEQIVDFNDEEGLKRLLQKGFAAEKRMQEAATKRREVDDLLHYLQNDPEDALRRLGKDPEKLAEAIIERKLREMEMSPEEKAKAEMEKKIADYEKKLQEIEKEKEIAQKSALQDKYAMELDQQITTALQEHPELPKSEYTVKRIANELYKYTQAGYDVTVSDILPVVKKRINSEIQQMFKSMPDDIFENWIGTDNSKRLKDIRKKKVQTKTQSPVSRIPSVPRKETAEPRKKIRAGEFFRKL